MLITGTHFNYYLICHRKLWLFANGINMESNSDLVYEGRLIHETSYSRRNDKYQEITIDGIKIDFYDRKNKVVHEIKKSDKHEEAHEWQVKYYLYVLEQNGVTGAAGLLEYPRLHKTTEVLLTTPDRDAIAEMLTKIESVIHDENCPDRIQKSKCKNCSYFDFCWSGEEEK
ncbi:CRISPR-associated exonuclease, Cas4 family [Tangfeifania diversioriginum]|uniref:CRISPR-associated exonuclease Cas4 n=1 Tax=Tangfeifania diversioriginum TaxID=1168035 RepID=A0A1M6LJ80_9BACT|nr:CRISPR-associated protein Cas4 [Tangfeifania diversioriginum]SHJ71234.1 CRISPR-associated exonuclease, Cas4 family [Tangfeifania diversioriginum]